MCQKHSTTTVPLKSKSIKCITDDKIGKKKSTKYTSDVELNLPQIHLTRFMTRILGDGARGGGI